MGPTGMVIASMKEKKIDCHCSSSIGNVACVEGR